MITEEQIKPWAERRGRSSDCRPMTEGAKSIPTGRLRRTAKVGGLLGAEVARSYATKAANVVRSDGGAKGREWAPTS